MKQYLVAIETCSTMVMKRGKLVKSEGIKLPEGRRIERTGQKMMHITIKVY